MEREACCRKRGRARRSRFVRTSPAPLTFKPRGISMKSLEVVEVKVEEMEAIRLVDLLGMELKDAAESMKISRRTMSRDLKAGRRKVADMLVNGKGLVVKGGDYELENREV